MQSVHVPTWVLETTLEGEITDHLGYGRHEVEGGNSGNRRNGTRVKMVVTGVGPVEVKVPRDVAGTFEPRSDPRRSRACRGKRVRGVFTAQP